MPRNPAFPLPLIVLLAMAPLVANAGDGYVDEIGRDKPVAWWRFNRPQAPFPSLGSATLPARTVRTVEPGIPGPRSKLFPLFSNKNLAVGLSGSDRLVVDDPGKNSPLDFANGDAITLESWVAVGTLAAGQHAYLVGKGRTNNPGQAAANQNWALRLTGNRGVARISFLFRNADNRPGTNDDFHRWTSNTGFPPGDGWHHVAVSYEFGKPKSLRGYLDGEAVSGTWDLGGQTTKPPVVDNDQVWIGSSLGGNPGNTLHGRLDEVAIYRAALPAARLAAHFQTTRPDPRLAELPDNAIAGNAVLVEVIEGLPKTDGWDFLRPRPVERWKQPALALVGLPRKYSARGLIVDRPSPFLLRLRTKYRAPAGKYRLLLRSRGAARLVLDGRIIATTNFINRNASGHENVPEQHRSNRKDLVSLSPGHQQRLVDVVLEDREYLVVVEAFVGGAGVRTELGELLLGLSGPDQPFHLLTASGHPTVGLSETDWDSYSQAFARQLTGQNDQRRRSSDPTERSYWNQRHRLARSTVSPLPVPKSDQRLPAVDSWLKQAGAKGRDTPLVNDHAFFRRLVLDTAGVVPAPAEVGWFLGRPRSTRRDEAIDRFLADPRWADHWVGYWQDVLAENPGILKPQLNNTGPFRFWIHESFRDNKPMDRFVTELVMMQGSRYGGGPAGFAMATQNDVPMAAKAHVLGTAFLAVELKCARCHDAPYHPFRQEQLFSIAAMLNQRPLTLPKTSTIPGGAPSGNSLVRVSLSPGAIVAPAWPFADLVSDVLPAGVLRNRSDQRERLAALITSPHNRRFPRVLVNRVWKRYLGWGLVEPVDDWNEAAPAYPELLDFLGRELVRSGYDLKHVARLILESRAYQRQVLPAEPLADGARRAAVGVRRRMTAEQLVDSLFVVSGKLMKSEALTLDPEGRRPATSFLNLGVPRRSWEFAPLSNERDRPALALPAAQSILDLLVAFGWRESRPHATTLRDGTVTVLQPLALANGSAAHRAVVLSDDHSLTRLFLEDRPLPQLVDRLYLQVLCRRPSPDERADVEELLAGGFSSRRVAGALPNPPPRRRHHGVSWSNHLSPEATRIKLELERQVREGDPPTRRLTADWRERAEDVLWALFNSPEFVFIP